MKYLLASFLLATASSTALMAAPDAAAPTVQAVKTEAPSLERVELARRFVKLTVSPDQFVETMREGSVQAAIAMSGDDPDVSQADLEREVARIFTLVEPKIRAQMPNIIESYAQVYAREFSVGELQQMVSFGESPAGKHYLNRAEFLTLDPELLGAFDAMQAEFAPVLEQIKKEKCAEKAAKRIAAGDIKAKCSLSASG
jgi:hypothetical protein